ncbi:hypothetical protein CY35_14G012100 [Sphagnum magellanicum]|nr:hypothetical protein CY35_14G012100 [Sphagnum magellanicum]
MSAEPLKFLGPLLESLVRLVSLIGVFDHSLVSSQDEAEFQMVMQLDIYDLTSSERVKRGVKRAWLIGETLALETGSGQKRPNIHGTNYKGVRFRRDRSPTKPWTAEVKPPKVKNKVWIDDCNTPEAAALAYDVAAFYYGKGNKALNFEHTPRFLPKTLEYACEKEKKHAIQEQARHLRRNPLFYLIHQLPYDLLFCFVIWELYPLQGQPQIRLALLVVQLMRLMRKDSSVIAFPKWVSYNEDISHLHAPTNIPQLLESIGCLIKKIPQQKQGYGFLGPFLGPYPQTGFGFLFQHFGSLRIPFEALVPTKHIPLTFQFIEWVRINLVTPQTSSTKAEDLPTSPPQCNVQSIMSVEIDLRAPQTSSMAMEAEDPLEDIPPNIHQFIEEGNAGTMNRCIWQKFSLESQHLTYQDATPEEQVVQSSIVEQAATIVLSTAVAAIVETPLLPSPPLDVEIPNEGFQTGDLYEDIQEGSMSGQMTSTLGTLSNFHALPFSCFSPLSTGAQTQSSTFMDSDVGKDLMVPIPSSMEVGDYHPKCNNLVVPLPPSHDYTWDALKQDLRNLDELPLQCGHLAFQITSPEEDECIKSPTVDQAATEFMDLDDGEDLATLFKRLQHDQLGDIGDWVASVEATLMEGCNPDINDMVLTSVPGHIEGNEINSLCEYEDVMEPPHPFAFSQQPFVQFDEYL